VKGENIKPSAQNRPEVVDEARGQNCFAVRGLIET
jgi:hypothetical protein